MPNINVNDCNYYYEIHGPGNNETIVFSHGLLWSTKLFHKQVEHLKDRYRIVAYDHRGQGQSEVTESGYDLEQLYEDAVALIEKLELGQVHFAGLSMGGFVGMRLAARRPDLVKSLILMETSARDEPSKLNYAFLNLLVKVFGVKIVTGSVMNIMFSKKFLNDPNREEEREEWKKELQSNQRTITRAVDGIVHRKGVENELDKITCPCLILVGDQDIATKPEEAEFIHSKIPQSILKVIEGGGHSACIEEPEQYNAEIEKFLSGNARQTG